MEIHKSRGNADLQIKRSHYGPNTLRVNLDRERFSGRNVAQKHWNQVTESTETLESI